MRPNGDFNRVHFDGHILLTGVMPGSYTLQGEAPGFQTSVEKGLQVHVQATMTVDMPLVAGKVANQVTVTAAAPLLSRRARRWDKRSPRKPSTTCRCRHAIGYR